MTVAKQWEKQGIQKGMQLGIKQGIEQGIEQGATLKAQETAHNFLSMGLSVDQVIEGTGLDRDTVAQLKKAIEKTRH